MLKNNIKINTKSKYAVKQTHQAEPAKKSSGMNSNRVIYFDYLRVFATYAVMILHIASQNWHKTDVNQIDWQTFNFYASIARWGVPIFLMMSGALFLSRDMSISHIFKKSVLRMFLTFVAWSFIYYLLAGNIFPDNLNNDSFITRFFALFKDGKTRKFVSIINSHYHLWFVPMIAGLYICVPIIKKVVEDKRIAKYFLLLAFIFQFIIPQTVTLVNDFGSENLQLITTAINKRINAMSMKMVLGFSFYFVLGYYLSNIHFDRKKKFTVYILGLFGFLFTILADLVVALKTQAPSQNYYGNFCVNIVFEAVAVFVLFKSINFNHEKFNCFIKLMSKWSFGAYLIHALFIEKLNSAFHINTLSLPMPSYFSVFVIAIIVFILSFGVSAILNSIPGIRKYIV